MKKTKSSYLRRNNFSAYPLTGHRPCNRDAGLQPAVALVTRPCPQTLGVPVHGQRAHVLAVKLNSRKTLV